MLDTIPNRAIVQTIPNLLPSSTIIAKAAGIEMLPPSLPSKHMPSTSRKLFPCSEECQKCYIGNGASNDQRVPVELVGQGTLKGL